MRPFIVLGLVLLTLPLFAQQQQMASEVRGLFDKPNKIEWLRHFTGYFDGISTVQVTLAYDGKRCRGQLRYVESKEVFWLQGTIKKGELRLQELDYNLNLSGYLSGAWREDQLLLNWYNHDQTITSELSLNALRQTQSKSVEQQLSLWVRSYRGLAFGQPIELLLQQESEDQIHGSIYYVDERQVYALSGHRQATGSLTLQVRNQNGQSQGTIEGVFKRNGNISANVFSASGQRSPTLLSIENNLRVNCRHYADYVANFAFTYPQTSHLKFNSIFGEMVDGWLERCTQKARQLRPRRDQNHPNLRASLHGNAWTEVELMNDRIFSCFITFQDSWSLTNTGRAINFDLNTGRELQPEDIFREEVDLKDFVWQYLDEHLDQLPLGEDKAFRLWLVKQDFPYVTLQQNGICFSTHFDSVYGRQKVVIPYERIQSYLLPDSPISYLLN